MAAEKLGVVAKAMATFGAPVIWVRVVEDVAKVPCPIKVKEVEGVKAYTCRAESTEPVYVFPASGSPNKLAVEAQVPDPSGAAKDRVSAVAFCSNQFACAGVNVTCVLGCMDGNRAAGGAGVRTMEHTKGVALLTWMPAGTGMVGVAGLAAFKMVIAPAVYTAIMPAGLAALYSYTSGTTM